MNTKHENRHYYLAFSHFQKIGPRTMKQLETSFPYIYEAFFTSVTALERAGLKPALAKEFVSWRNSNAASIDNMLARLAKEGISFLIWHDSEYPALLKEISAPPFVLYYKGVLVERNNRLAVVGSRKFSAYGEKVISELLPETIKKGIIIVSGLALGIDAIAHREVLKQKGVTWAVLGSGLDAQNIYPPENRRLAESIIANGGALISEFPPETPPCQQNFPQRNRIIAGLSQATLVIESKIKSGALITANYALEENREVLAVPGNIFSEFSAGPNLLIQSGARSITSPADILDVYGLNDYNLKKNKNLTAEMIFFSPENENEAIIYKLLKETSERAEIISADDLARLTKLDSSIINSTLSILELRGVVKCTGFGYALN